MPLFIELMAREDLTRPQVMVYIAIAVCHDSGHQPSIDDVARMARTARGDFHRGTRRAIRELERKGLLKRVNASNERLRFELLGPRL
jgi:Fe2+ or Zn2+ uptake regulation protein